MDLFDQHLAKITEEEAPLAARMRPRTLDEFSWSRSYYRTRKATAACY